MNQDQANQYFQEYSIFSNPEYRPFDFNREDRSQDPFLPHLREPLSQEISQQNNLHLLTQQMQKHNNKAKMKTADMEEQQNPQLSNHSNSSIVFDEMARCRYKAVFQGSKDDTVELNINFKTLLVNYFKELTLANELNIVEIRRINQFSCRVPSFQSLKQLFKQQPDNQNIRALGLKLFTSSECIRKVMAGRSKLKTKIQMIKYIEKIRINILIPEEIIRWKDVTKKSQ